jgi:beta-galactosidase GanA
MRRAMVGLIAALLVLALPSAAHAHSVTFDKYSLKVDGQRVYLWSGEIHPYRLPSPDLWRDVLQKMKANGYNGVSIYVDWSYHSPKPGVYDFSGVRDLDKFFDIANELGIYVMVRPGPYINAETDAGGFPGWLTTKAGTARTNNATYMSYTDEYQSHIDPIVARHQLTNDTGTVILYQIENEYANNVTTQTGIQYMKHLYDKARADGITVPILHNDKGRNGYWVPGAFTGADGLAGPNLYGFDGYPGGTCSSNGSPGTPATPPDWGYFGTGGATGGASASPNTPGAMIEFGGGWFDPWGDQLFGGAGYACLAARQNGGYERDYYLTALANGIKIQNIYMTFGGTSWGWLPAPVVYTSYDYGAAWDEGRQPRVDKVSAMKAMGYMVQSVAPLSQLDKVGTVTASNSAVKVYHLSNPETGTHVYLPRHSTQSTSDLKFTFPISTADGDFTIPQSGQVELKGEDMKALLANYSFDSQHLVYSTADVMTHAALPGTDVLVVQGRPGQTGETVLSYASEPAVDAPAGVTSTYSNGQLRIDYPINGFAEVKIGGAHPLRLLIADDNAVATLWREETSAGPVIVRGPALIRTAAVSGDTLNLTGDTTNPADLQVWGAPANVTWNGAPVTGTLAGAPAVTLPSITGWRYRPESPEAQPSFDDSTWANADKTTSNSRTAVPSGQKVLFADDYGFHNGPVWYRGTYSGAGAATQVRLVFQTGTVGLLQAWLDGQFLGFMQTPVPMSSEATTATWNRTATFNIPDALKTDGPHKLAVMVNAMGHEEDGGANDAFKNARGLTSATFTGATAPIAWKIQGNQGGEDITDTVRGFVNESGLYGERAGWHLAGYPDAGWASVSLPYSDPAPGTAWYRTTFDLDMPANADTSLGLDIRDLVAKAYRALIFVNGWNLGQYINNVGPQHTFVLPNGILRPHGHNTLAIAVTSNAPGAGGLGTVKLVNLGTAKSSLTVNDVDSPAYERPTIHPAVLDGTSIDGPVATLDIPPDALGTAFAASIDWGDGSTSEGSVANGTVNGTHTYAQPGRHRVTILLSDRYGAAALAEATADTGTVGATVPAQLSLTLGPAASFGAFTPGVEHTYEASTTANVISTAGDAALSVSDPGHLANGAFSLPEPLQVTFSKASWTGPVSNDLVNIGFAQHIGANDALRTGSYSKTLTFTLSTTAP